MSVVETVVDVSAVVETVAEGNADEEVVRHRCLKPIRGYHFACTF